MKYSAKNHTLAKLHDSSDWRDSAACIHTDPEIFFPSGATQLSAQQTSKAKSICHTCTVTENCLAYAIETGQETGIWGGLSESERKALKRKSARKKKFYT